MAIRVGLLLLAATLLASFSPAWAGASSSESIRQAVRTAAEGEHRSRDNRVRNRYRHPAETLAFFGLERDMTLVEVWPGTGWYTEVLAPVLRQEGQLIAASFPADGEPAFRGRIRRTFEDKLADHPEVFDRVRVVDFNPPEHARLGKPGSADMVLLSRHFHNFIDAGITDAVLAASREVLRPGGILAVVQHRAPEDAVPEAEQRTGYVRESLVIEEAREAGFELEARSEINANPKDTAEHPAGVWTLPPTLRYCRNMEDPDRRSECVEKYQAIGESDRMTLRFRKPR